MTSAETRRRARNIARILGAELHGQPRAEVVPLDEDEKLGEAAQGIGATAEDSPEGTGEVDEIGRAAGLNVRDDEPFRGDEVDRRDNHRWELDPRSKQEEE